MAVFLQSDENFSIYRKFGTCHARILAEDQVELTKIEEVLHQLDKTDSEDRVLEQRLRGPEPSGEPNTERRELMRKLRVKIREYGDSPTANCMILGEGKLANSRNR